MVDNEHKLLVDKGFKVRQQFFDNRKISPLNSFYNRESYKIITEEIEDFKPDIVHVHNIFYNASPSVLMAAKKAKIPVVMTLHNFRLLCPGAYFLRDGKACIKCKDIVFPYHGVVHKCFKDSRTKSLVLALFLGLNKTMNTWNKNIDKFIALTPFIKTLLLSSSLGLHEDSIVVKANSTDDFLDNSNPHRKGFLFVGRLSKEKGVDILVDAFNLMPQYDLEIIGSGEMAEMLKSKAKQNIVFHGNKDRSFIKSKLAKTRALVFPSIWYEGLPNTIIEAFSSGTPVLASNMDNINQIISDGYNGETFVVDNANSIIEKVIEFSQKDISKYQKNARSTFEKKYTHMINYQNLVEIYSGLLQDKSID